MKTETKVGEKKKAWSKGDVGGSLQHSDYSGRLMALAGVRRRRKSIVSTMDFRNRTLG